MNTASQIQSMKGKRQLSMLTAYDALFANIFDRVDGLDMLLIGDSLGNVIAGQDSTVPVTLQQLIYHAKLVRRGVKRLFLVADMPFMTYPFPFDQSLSNIKQVIQETGAHAVKVEGASDEILRLVEASTQMGVAVMGHIGLTPQQVNREGYRRKGKTEEEASCLVKQAKALESAGVFSMVLECVQPEVAAEMTRAVTVPTIGIGSGTQCDGQVLVFADLLGLTPEPPPFVKPLAQLREQVQSVVETYVSNVQKQESF